MKKLPKELEKQEPNIRKKQIKFKGRGKKRGRGHKGGNSKECEKRWNVEGGRAGTDPSVGEAQKKTVNELNKREGN